jgi:type III secretion protein V
VPASAQNPVILTSIDVRRTLRDLIAIEFPKMAVLSYQELSPDLRIQSIGKISLPQN